MAKDTKVIILTIKDIDDKRSHNVRRHYGDIDALARSINNEGQAEPIHVHDEGNGKYRLLRGFRRLKAIKSLKKDTVRAIVLDNMTEQEKLSYTIDQGERESLTRTEVALAVRKMVNGGFSEKAIMYKLYPLFVKTNWSKPVVNPSKDPVDFAEQIATSLKGAYQNAKRMATCDDRIFDLWARGFEGNLKEGEPKISFQDVKNLERIKKEGQDEEAYIKNLVEKGIKPKNTKPKTLGMKDLDTLEEIMKSKLAKAIIKRFKGETVENLLDLDEAVSKAGM